MWDIAKVLEYYGADGVPDGTNRPIRCPFHDDRQASGSVSTDSGLYNCHGCPAGGDAISLIRQQEGVDYETALKRATEITGESHRGVRESAGGGGGRSLLPGWARDKHGDSSGLPSWFR